MKHNQVGERKSQLWGDRARSPELRDKDGGEGRTWSVWVVMVEELENIRPRPFEEWEHLANDLRQAREEKDKPSSDRPQAVGAHQSTR